MYYIVKRVTVNILLTNFMNNTVICISSYFFYYSAFLVSLFCRGLFEVNGDVHLFATLIYITT